MTKLADRICRLSESATLAMSQKSRELREQGIDVINLSIGEPDFNTPEHIKDAAKKALDENFTRYSPVPGYPELRKAISEKFKRENNLDYAIDEIIVSTGAKNSISNVIMCLVNHGEEVIMPAPYWVSYKEIVMLARGEAIVLPTSIVSNFKITAEQLEKAITPKSKILIFSSPCNPTGSVYSKEELRAIAEVVAKYEDLFIISDEIYEHINFVGKHESIAQFDFIKDRVITVNGVSKGYAMTGWRIGYIGAPKWIVKACDKLQGQLTSGTNSIAQRASIAALQSGDDFINTMRATFKHRRDLVLSLLADVPGIKTNVPDGAFYIFADASYYIGKNANGTIINNMGDLSIYLLNNAHVALVPGEAFGDPNCIRFSYATSDDLIIESVKRVKSALSNIQ
ncbi:MAG: pyridoxal phosphate-dependent aminotransferase [Bacteroidetes bacterium]|nr:pyridoxal phosphate-dependent aminotransferase [Bacteroidota bacterium]MBU1721012.1 pyridoxal phosphate-dependent aminotransferase [Bacteroidota bacterium]